MTQPYQPGRGHGAVTGCQDGDRIDRVRQGGADVFDQVLDDLRPPNSTGMFVPVPENRPHRPLGQL